MVTHMCETFQTTFNLDADTAIWLKAQDLDLRNNSSHRICVLQTGRTVSVLRRGQLDKMFVESQSKFRGRGGKVVENASFDLLPKLIPIIGQVGREMQMVDRAVEKAKYLYVEPSCMSSSDEGLNKGSRKDP